MMMMVKRPSHTECTCNPLEAQEVLFYTTDHRSLPVIINVINVITTIIIIVIIVIVVVILTIFFRISPPLGSQTGLS